MARKKKSPRVNQKAKAYLAKKVKRKMPPKSSDDRAKKLLAKNDPGKKK